MAEKKSIYKSGKRNPNGYYSTKNRRKERMAIIIASILICFSLIMSCLDHMGIFTWSELNNSIGMTDGPVNPDNNFSVYYLDVGQGDCTIIKSNDSVMMIDTSTENRNDDISEALMTLSIDTIDYLVITHQHDDHMGSATAIIEKYNVKNVIMPKLTEINMVTTNTYETLLKAIANNKINAIPATVGESFSLGDATVNILSPIEQDEDLNNMSVVLKVVYGETSFLFQGDAEKTIEKQLLASNFDISADVLKLGHHGSNTSSTDKYIQAVEPQIAIISCGADNSYGHPHKEIIDRLKKYNIDFYITAQTGDITITSDGKNIDVKTQKEEWLPIYE